MSPKQTLVIQWFNNHDELTLKEAVKLIGGNIVHNQSFHVANVLRNMEKRKMLVKVKRAVWKSTNQYRVMDSRDVMPGMRQWAEQRGLV